MNALILAAGLGTRLKPLTLTMPKAMVHVCGKPLLQHQIERLKKAGCTNIVVNVHHFAEQIIDFLNTNQNFGIDIRISDERQELLNTGGAIKKAGPLFASDEPILVHNVDILHNADLGEFYRSHAASDCAVLMTSDRHSSRSLIARKDDNRLVGWHNAIPMNTRDCTAKTTMQGIPISSIVRVSLASTSSRRPCCRRWQSGVVVSL